MLFCGIDLHSNNSFVVISDENDNVLYSKRLPIYSLDLMSETLYSKPRSALWRAIKVFFGAWAFAVAGTIVFAVVIQVVGGSAAIESLRYATVVLFLLGVPIMARWLK